ncbi:ketopantoate reductase family protein [Brachybacterium avium]|uniref:ketopantoate reductase family protein n=1 Tax=Brachybacterium avium TaxID=2017485 RepID=UPI0012FE4D5A|nr:2-dehydropantoate 2-reductase N-terminal domain-containing protein [Brachybacterium avium]
MSTIAVVGAGVIGQTYAGLLADAGHDVSIVARGRRADQLRMSGIVLHRDGSTTRPRCRVVDTLAEARNAEVVMVAVRGEQLPSVQAEAAASLAPIVVCMSNPLGQREAFEQDVGAERTVFTFSGIGGLIADDGSVHYHSVRQQPTVVDAAASAGAAVAELMGTTALAVHREHQMASWLDTHSVFIAGIGAAVLTTENGAPGVSRSRERARQIVGAISEAFDALQGHGVPIRPAALRTIFGRVPTWFAARYWQRQFGGPLVQVSIAPHVLATRFTEFPQVAAHALSLVGRDAPRFRSLVMPCASPGHEA